MPNPMDFLSSLRLKNIFPSQGPFGNDLPEQGGFGGNMPRINPFEAQAMEVNPVEHSPLAEYEPSHDMSDKLEALLGMYPQREKPTMMRRIGAGILGGLTNASVGSQFLNKPFTDKLIDWKNQVGPTAQAAGLERQSNVNERTLAYQTAAQQLREEAQKHKEANDETNSKIRQQRADIYEYKAKNPDLKMVMPKGGNIQVMDPATGELKDTGVPTGSLSEADKLALGHDFKTQEITQRGDITSRQIGERGEESRTTKATPSGSNKNGSSAELPTQTRVRQFNAARELANTRPELKQFIKVGTPGSNDFQITPPGKNFFGQQTGPTPQQYKEMQDKIYGMSTATSHDTPVTPADKTTAKVEGSKPPLPADKVRVQTADGRTGMWPRAKASQLPKGWKVIQDK